mmetsp:Transcript_5105/g.9818  ORF Transcript_5105/g.9818 Transcript_5105/m.9818 type:complete len:470 (+) Transcript_5105:30-1439(+)
MLSILKSKIVRTASTSSEIKDGIEERKMRSTIRKMMSQQEKKVECVSEIVLTFGKEETELFAMDSLVAQNEGMPYFRRCSKEIGKHHQIVIWMRSSTAQSGFITELKVGHAISAHHLFINGRDYGLLPILHERMKGDQRDEPTACLWYKKDTASLTAIDDIAVSYTRKDEQILRKENYEKLPTNLEELGLAPAYLWIRRVKRTSIPNTTKDVTRMKTELKDCTSMLAKDPHDPILRAMVSKMRKRIRFAQAEEDVRTKCNPTDPLLYAKEFLALTTSEIDRLRSSFGRIPSSRSGYISLQDFCRYVGEKDALVPFIRHVFKLSGANAATDKSASDCLDFGTTVKAIACYCMLGVEEILQSIFSLRDHKDQGSISNRDFLDVLSMFHSRHCGRTTRALRGLDLPEAGKMSFGRLQHLHTSFPHLLFPAFRLQEAIQRRFLGCKWWQRKQRKFYEIKETIRRDDGTATRPN